MDPRDSTVDGALTLHTASHISSPGFHLISCVRKESVWLIFKAKRRPARGRLLFHTGKGLEYYLSCIEDSGYSGLNSFHANSLLESRVHNHLVQGRVPCMVKGALHDEGIFEVFYPA